MIAVADNTKDDSMENTVHVNEVAAEKVAEKSTQNNENIAKASKSGNYICMTRGDREVEAEKPIMEKK